MGRQERKLRASKRREGAPKEGLTQREADVLHFLDGEKPWSRLVRGAHLVLHPKPGNFP
jgi:hypothetical protein